MSDSRLLKGTLVLIIIKISMIYLFEIFIKAEYWNNNMNNWQQFVIAKTSLIYYCLVYTIIQPGMGLYNLLFAFGDG